MQNKPLIATHRIIVFVVFICTALITSLFVYHSSQKSASLLAPEIGVTFTEKRDIKAFKLEQANNQFFTEKDFYNHWTLLFFGFTHCSKVCPTTLELMNKAYEKLHIEYPNLRVVLISVDPERDTPASMFKYVQSFNTNFIGATGKVQEIRKLQSQLGVYSSRESSSSNTNYQVQHTSSIMLINPQGKWAGLFKFGLRPIDLIQGVETVINKS